jgi:hypothetical protein
MIDKIKQWFRCAFGFHKYEYRTHSLGFSRNGTLIRMQVRECIHCGEIDE